MNAKTYNAALLEAFKQQLEAGHAIVSTRAVVEYLQSHSDQLEGPSAVDEAKLDKYRAELETWVEEHRSHHAQQLEMFRSVITAGQSALRTAFLMNGGAAVALLAFIGHLAAVDPKEVSEFALSLIWFVGGVATVGVASGVTYLSQWLYADWKRRKGTRIAGLVLNIVAIVLGLFSYAIFVAGMVVSYDALANYA